MSFVYAKYLVPMLLLFVGFTFLIVKYERNFFTWIKDHWFYERTLTSKISTFLYLAGFFLLFLSLLDLRGREEQVNAKIVDQKTILIVDASASMLVEDVRPNRFQKALLMARHFVKKSVGHQIAIVAFSDTQKRLIPFTDDLDLLDARVAAMEDMKINNGGSNIIQAIRESVQYFKSDVDDGEKITGNILLFTDSEDNGEMESLTIPEGINLAVVAVGTRKGGTIPLRDHRGRLVGNKKFKGKEVVSKIDEEFLKKLGSQVDNYKYWVALSYSIPTEDILSFFRTQFKARMSEGNVRVRPVKGYNLIAMGILFLIAAFALRIKKSLVIPVVSVLMILNFQKGNSQEMPEVPDEIQAEIGRLMLKDQEGQLDRHGRLKLAELLLIAKKPEDAMVLYDENIEGFEKHSDNEIFNYATALLQNERINDAVVMLNYLKNRIKNDENKKELRDNVNKNILKALEEQKKKQDQKKDGESDNKDQQQDGDGKGQGNSGENQQQNQKQSKQGQGEQDKNQKEDEKKKDKGQGDKKDENKEKTPKPQSLEEKEEEIKKKRKMVKIPAVIKQILNDDRSLQKKHWKTSTQQNQRDKKDW